MKILELYKTASGLVYTMPLADNINSEENYIAASLANYANFFKAQENFMWFNIDMIKEFSASIFDAALELNSYGLLHRDIKPSNILFVQNKAYLADFGIIQEDTQFPKEMGTSSYIPPYSYIESGGNPDMWGLASTLFYMLSGYDIEFFDRAFAQYPKGYEDYFEEAEIEQYTHWRRCILRAVSENKSRRFVSLESFKASWFSAEQAKMTDEEFNALNDNKLIVDLNQLTTDKVFLLMEKAIENESNSLFDDKKSAENITKLYENFELKGLEEFIADIAYIIKESPRDGNTYFFKALALWQLKRDQEALESIEKAIELKTIFLWRSYRIKAYALANLGQIDLAKIAMSKSEELKILTKERKDKNGQRI